MTLLTSLFSSKMVFQSRTQSKRDAMPANKRGRRAGLSAEPELLECRRLLTAPVLNPNGDPTLDPINEDISSGANVGTLVSTVIARMSPGGGIFDADVGALKGIAVIGANQTNGTWQFSTNGGGTWANFGSTSSSSALFLASNASTRVRFVPNTNYNGSSGFTYTAWDQTSGSNGTKASALVRGGATSLSVDKDSAFITVTPVNDAPVLNPNGNPTVDAIPEDLPVASNNGTFITTIIARMSPGGGISDVDAAPINGIAIIGTNQDHGTWQFSTNNGTSWTNFGATSSASALFLAANASTRVRFLPDANFNGTSGFTYVGWDQTTGTNGTKASALVRGGSSSLSINKDSAFITVNSVNDAPIVNAAGNPTLDDIPENIPLASNAGTLVSTILNRMAPGGGIVDFDSGAVRGMAIIGSNQNNGIWQFSTNGGGTWGNFGAASPTNALLLASDANTRIRFVPNPDFDGTRGFTFLAWDQTSGANGGRGVTTSPGGSSAFSINTENVFITVTNVNRAPILNPGGNLLLNSLTDIGNQGTSIADLISRMAPDGGISDPDVNDPKGIAITATTQSSNDKWQYSTDSGATWFDVGATGATSALLLAGDGATRVRYVANGTFTGFVRFDYIAWDQSAGTNGTKTDVTNRGGSTPFSVATDSALLVVNTAPVLDTDGTPILSTILTNSPDASNTGDLIQDIIASMAPNGGITDVDPKAEQGIAITSANQLNGRWQFSLDNGSSWTDYGTGNINRWLLLASDDSTRLRFVPKPDFKGTARLNFIAWDQTSGTNGTFVDAGARGGSTAFSIATETTEIGVGTDSNTSSDFDIVILFPDGTVPDNIRSIFLAAAQRWSEIIIGDVPDVFVDGLGQIDDVVITAVAPSIDGAGGVLGQAGPDTVRPGSFIPSSGTMEFDIADLNTLLAAGQLDEVILHEMAHVLGFGTIWQDLGLINGSGTADPRFTGTQATNEYRSIFGVTDISVPLETQGGPGTAEGHWSEEIFDNELMTGFLNPGVPNPLSRITAASMADLGYVVDLAAADAYTDPTPIQGAATVAQSSVVRSYQMLPPKEYRVLGEDAFINPVQEALPLPVTLITSSDGIRIWDLVSGSMDGIAVTGTSSTGGIWQYTTNGGVNWTNVGSVSTGGALTLAADASTRLRFVADGSSALGSEVSFLSWDATGTNGGSIDASDLAGDKYVARISNSSLTDLEAVSATVIDEYFSLV
ncbi:MAG: hypothetical protein KDA68_09915 [Planctomycetaceae bacterium]|nr:hypothetical protein [Planctomycetaceae bacterium]